MEWMILPLKRYADFQGRSRRLEYWMFTLGGTILALLLVVPFFVFTDFGGNRGGDPGAGSIILLAVLSAFYISIIIPSLAVQVRRFHDQDKSGWFILLGFIPYIGGLILLVFMCLEGTHGPNRFGPDPKRPDEDLDTVFR
ncbi:MAG: DUF805 domain-containing protein [Sphingobium sp.]|nr:DUF805 domain-containing protein [Sphingobium sp.]